MNKTLMAILTVLLPVSCAPSPAYPAGPQSMVARSPTVEVRLFPGPRDRTKVALPVGAPSAYRAKVLWQGQDFEACWFVIDQDTIGVVDESGDAGVVPARAFKLDDGV